MHPLYSFLQGPHGSCFRLNCRWELRDLDDNMTITTIVLPTSRAPSLRGGGISVPQLRRQLRTAASSDTLMTTLRGYRNTTSNNTYSTHIYSSPDQATTATATVESTGIHLISDRSSFLALTATRTHLRSASLSHQVRSFSPQNLTSNLHA